MSKSRKSLEVDPAVVESQAYIQTAVFYRAKPLTFPSLS